MFKCHKKIVTNAEIAYVWCDFFVFPFGWGLRPQKLGGCAPQKPQKLGGCAPPNPKTGGAAPPQTPKLGGLRPPKPACPQGSGGWQPCGLAALWAGRSVGWQGCRASFPLRYLIKATGELAKTYETIETTVSAASFPLRYLIKATG